MRRRRVLRSALAGNGSRSPGPAGVAGAAAEVTADCSEAVDGAGVEARVVSELGAGDATADDIVSSLSRSSSGPLKQTDKSVNGCHVPAAI